MNTKIELENLSSIDMLDRDDLVKIITRMATGGVAVMFNGKRTAMEIQKKVRPRAMRKRPDLSYGTDAEQSNNIILEGENLQGILKANGQMILKRLESPGIQCGDLKTERLLGTLPIT